MESSWNNQPILGPELPRYTQSHPWHCTSHVTSILPCARPSPTRTLSLAHVPVLLLEEDGALVFPELSVVGAWYVCRAWPHPHDPFHSPAPTTWELWGFSKAEERRAWFLEFGLRLWRVLGSWEVLGGEGTCGMASGLPASFTCSELGGNSASRTHVSKVPVRAGPLPRPSASSALDLARLTSSTHPGPACRCPRL